ncbi:hypothetical protein COLO4_03937 [Corchorus olitorius]|uniref:Uncharacterized protein n=1 Tax=Corchorus olitorius TaxID=93759 RepID=A0A1R3KVX9_9ROSI|nr:hypothetical protein COLO4_03937 [Corchorus olitorius]
MNFSLRAAALADLDHLTTWQALRSWIGDIQYPAEC